MSSHHFVREGQEPALVIIDAIAYERIAPLLEWAPFVIVHETPLDEVLRWELGIDGVICRSKEVSRVSDIVADQMPLAIIEFDPDQGGIHSAIEFLAGKKQEAVCLVVDDAEKVMKIPSVSISKLNVTLLTPALRWSLITHGSFEKWAPSGQEFFSMPGTNFIDRKGVMKDGHKLISEQDGLIKLSSDRPFWIGEEY